MRLEMVGRTTMHVRGMRVPEFKSSLRIRANKSPLDSVGFSNLKTYRRIFSPDHAAALLLCLCFAACSSNRTGDAPGKNSLASTAKSPSGAGIYRAQCVKCHGKMARASKANTMTRSTAIGPIEKLTRYIDKNMPDDDPEKCVGADAAAVARYINDAFYSREARARNHPARVELVRLTNRQYANTVADLIKHFTGADNSIGNERGLRGNFRKGRGGRGGGDGGGSDRLDRTIDFDFSERGPGRAAGRDEPVCPQLARLDHRGRNRRVRVHCEITQRRPALGE
jgi:hypothetical protein